MLQTSSPNSDTAIIFAVISLVVSVVTCLITTLNAIYTIRKTKLELKKLLLEIEEKERQTLKEKKNGDPLIVTLSEKEISYFKELLPKIDSKSLMGTKGVIALMLLTTGVSLFGYYNLIRDKHMLELDNAILKNQIRTMSEEKVNKVENLGNDSVTVKRRNLTDNVQVEFVEAKPRGENLEVELSLINTGSTRTIDLIQETRLRSEANETFYLNASYSLKLAEGFTQNIILTFGGAGNLKNIKSLAVRTEKNQATLQNLPVTVNQ